MAAQQNPPELAVRQIHITEGHSDNKVLNNSPNKTADKNLHNQKIIDKSAPECSLLSYQFWLALPIREYARVTAVL